MTLRLALALAFFALGCSAMSPSKSAPAAERHPLVGAVAPDFELSAPDGKQRVSLKSTRGNVVVIDFWATWCAPCRESFPVYQRLFEKYGGRLALIGVSVDDDPSGITKFANDTGAKFPLAWDDAQRTSRAYEPPTMPTSYVLDENGVVRFVHPGFYVGEERELEREITSLLP